MPKLSALELLWIVNIAVEMGVVLKISRSGLAPYFKYFRLFLIAESLHSAALLYTRYVLRDRNLYGELFMGWSYASSIFYFLVLQELTVGALERFPAIMAASKNTLRCFWAVIAAVGVGWYLYLSSLPTQQFPYLYSALRYQDAAAVGFTLFAFLFLAFVSWMPVPLTPNRLNHSFLLGGLFLTTALSRIIPELGSYADQRAIGSFVGIVGSSLVLLSWYVKILEKDEQTLRTPKGELDNAEAAVMIARLEELNRTLSRSGPRVVR